MYIEDWAREMWKYLHATSISYPDTPTEEDRKRIRGMLENLWVPCIAECMVWYKETLKTYPLTELALSSRKELIKWFIWLHNQINKKLNKKIITHEEAVIIFKEWYVEDVSFILSNEDKKIPISSNEDDIKEHIPENKQKTIEMNPITDLKELKINGVSANNKTLHRIINNELKQQESKVAIEQNNPNKPRRVRFTASATKPPEPKPEKGQQQRRRTNVTNSLVKVPETHLENNIALLVNARVVENTPVQNLANMIQARKKVVKRELMPKSAGGIRGDKVDPNEMKARGNISKNISNALSKGFNKYTSNLSGKAVTAITFMHKQGYSVDSSSKHGFLKANHIGLTRPPAKERRKQCKKCGGRKS
jgi:hypothetical protein